MRLEAFIIGALDIYIKASIHPGTKYNWPNATYGNKTIYSLRQCENKNLHSKHTDFNQIQYEMAG